MSNGRLDGQGLVDESVFQVFARLDDAVVAQIKRMNELEAATRSALGGTAVGKGADGLADAVKKSNTALSEQEKVLKEINALRERNTQVTSDSLRQLAEERLKRSQITRALKDEVIASGTLGQSYAALRKQRDLAANSLRDLISSQTASNREIRNAAKEFAALDARVRQADKAIGNFRDKVGDYGSAVRGVLGFTRELVGAFGVYSAIQVGQEIYEQVRALDSLKFGLEQVTETQEGFNNAQSFLSALAERAGADLLVLTRRYTNFLAAAKTTNLTLKQTQDVFENVVVAGAVLGRTTDDTNGSLIALEQILSKGKVQAEELRGQLGERLPGAFQILEKALGLTVGELNELLEVGGLLSVDAIPALSRGLEETFNLDLVDRVETLAAAQGRLSTAFSQFLQELEEGGGVIGDFFRGVLDFLTLAVEGFALLTRNQEEADAYFSRLAEQESFTNTLKSIREEAEKTGTSLQEVARVMQSDFTEQLNLAQAQVKSLQKDLAANPSLLESIAIKGELDLAIAKLNLYQGGLRAVVKVLKDAQDSTAAASDETAEYANTLVGLRERLKDLQADRDNTDFLADPDKIKRLNREIANVDEQIKRLTDSFKEAKKQRDDFTSEDSIAFLEITVKNLEKAKNEVAVGGSAWLMYAERVKEAREALDDLRATSKALEGDISGLPELLNVDEVDFAAEVDDFLNNQGLDVVLEDFANRFKLSKEEVIEEYIDLYGRDFEKFKEFEEKKLEAMKLIQRERVETARAGLDLVDALGESFLEIQLNRLDEEEDRQNKVFDSIVNNKEISEEQIAAAEQKRTENEERLAAARAKAEKKAFLFKQALAVADVFLAQSVGLANAAASTAKLGPLGPATFAALAGLIYAQTGIALGTILAQSLPAFFFNGKGIGDDYEGKGIWGELRREVLVDAKGGVTVSPDGPTEIDVKSSDIIHRSMGDFISSLKTNSATAQRIRQSAKRGADNNLTVLSRQGAPVSNFNEERLIQTIRKAFSRARITTNFNVEKDLVIRRIP
jgi:tape measure domain-containing protein